MIPKIVHYCWFGRGEKPASLLRYMDTWKRQLPDYEIVEWNEDNFDISQYAYSQEAYEARRFAFVSDVARLYALHTMGGFYLDTDVELLKSLDPFLEAEGVMGIEREGFVATCFLGAPKGCAWVKELLEMYSALHFIGPDGTQDLTTNVVRLSHYLEAHGLKKEDKLQVLPGIATVYPSSWFSPLHPLTGRLRITADTVAIHFFEGSWKGAPTPVTRFRKWVMSYFGEKTYYKIRAVKLKIFPKPWK